MSDTRHEAAIAPAHRARQVFAVQVAEDGTPLNVSERFENAIAAYDAARGGPENRDELFKAALWDFNANRERHGSDVAFVNALSGFAAARGGEAEGDRLRWLLDRAGKYIATHAPTQDLQHEICAALSQHPEPRQDLGVAFGRAMDKGIGLQRSDRERQDDESEPRQDQPVDQGVPSPTCEICRKPETHPLHSAEHGHAFAPPATRQDQPVNRASGDRDRSPGWAARKAIAMRNAEHPETGEREAVTQEEVDAAMRIVPGDSPLDFRAECGLCMWRGPTRATPEAATADSFEHGCFAYHAAPPEPLQDGGERPETWRVAFNDGDAAEAGQRVEDMLNGDPLRRHTTLTPEQFALDSKLMAKQILANVLAALKGEPRPS